MSKKSQSDRDREFRVEGEARGRTRQGDAAHRDPVGANACPRGCSALPRSAEGVQK